MSRIFGSSKTPKLPAAAEEIEPVEEVEEDAGLVRRRERKKLRSRGRQQTMLSGIATALKKRLGE